MNEREKKEYLDQYKKQKEKGVPFFPDIMFKDVIVSLIIFLILAALAYFVGVPTEARADPERCQLHAASGMVFPVPVPAAEVFSGKLEVIGVVADPQALILLLLALPFIDTESGGAISWIRPFASVAALGGRGRHSCR